MSGPWAVLLDFDGTLTSIDVSDDLLKAFGGVRQEEIEASYAPQVRVERWMRERFRRVRRPIADLRRRALRTVRPREGARSFLRACLERGIPVEVVSGGIDLYLDPLLERWGFPGVRRFRAKASWTPRGLRLDYRYLRGATLSQFKRSRVLRHQRAGRRVLFAGDGGSDLAAARAADAVFARGALWRQCRAEGLRPRPLETFDGLLEVLCTPR